MAILTSAGIESTSLNEYKTRLQIIFLSSLGADLDLAPQTVEGQLIGIFALSMSDIDDAVVQEYQQQNIFNAAGNQLDGFGATFGITRTAQSFSTAVVTVMGVPAAIIPAGSTARTTNGDLFQADAEIVIGPGGSSESTFSAIESGAIAIDANTLTQIVSVVTGWETIDNPLIGVLGEDEETDTAYRATYFQTLAKNAASTVEAISARVAALETVEAVFVKDNVKDINVTIQNVTLLPHSIAVVVSGGVAQEIGDAIYDSKPPGSNTAGADTGIQTEVIVDVPGSTVLTKSIFYYPVVFVTVEINVVIQQYEIVPDVEDLIKEAIVAYFDGTLTDTSEPIGIAESSYLSRLYTPINSVGGFEVLSLEQEVQGSGTPETVITPNLNEQLVVSTDSISVTIT